MTLQSFLDSFTQIVFLFLAASTFLDWMRQRDRARLDITLVFMVLAVTILLQDLQRRDPNRYVRLRSAAALRQIGPREVQ